MGRDDEIPATKKRGRMPVAERLKALNEQELFAVLSTIEPGPGPYASLISFALTDDLRYLVFATPRKTRKYKNILQSGKVAVLIDNRGEVAGDIMATEALTVMGGAQRAKKGNEWEALAVPFLRKHPNLEDFVKSPAVALIRVSIDECIHVGQFQTVSTWKRSGTRDEG
jgi:nitroimidazol reductase NimA-like FMN-containing flavoprotein (pyridoxamine 5'-phosphate oxidase superfamily)